MFSKHILLVQTLAMLLVKNLGINLVKIHWKMSQIRKLVAICKIRELGIICSTKTLLRKSLGELT